MLWACVLLPHLALDAILRRHPFPDQPLVLVTGPAQRRVVVGINAAAAQCGLRRGQSLAAAEALCEQVTVVEHDAEALERWRRFLAAWAYRYSSEVSTALPNAIVLEVEGSFGVIGSWPTFEARLRHDLTALGFRHRIALAPSATAAWVLAGHQDGLAVLQPGIAQRALAQVPVDRARLPGNAADALSRLGIRTLRQVFALPRASLAKRYGPDVLAHLDRLLGQAPELLPRYQPPDVFDLKVELNYDVTSSEALLFPLRRLTADLAMFLAGRDGGVQRFVVMLEHEGRPASEVTIGLLAPEREAARLFDLAKLRLEQLRVPAPVRSIRLVARELPPFVPAGRDLFEDRVQQALDWPQLRERLRARLGNEAVYTLAPAPDYRPEYSWTLDAAKAVTAPIDAHPRPTWLLPRPLPLRDPRWTVLAGPERIESGWWDGGDVKRDYYVIQTSLGQRAWAYCAAGEFGPFMLHGWFA